MDLHRRDALLAAGALAAVLTAGLWTTGPRVFGSPVAVVVGVGGALAIEWLFLSYPDALLRQWRRPWVAAVSALCTVGVAVLALSVLPWLLGAVGWGLVTYLCLLACVWLGFGNPAVVLKR